MALIETAEDSLEIKKIRQADLIRREIEGAFMNLQNNFARIFRSVWKNPELSPQEVFDAFGTKAYKLFQIAGAIETLNATVAPELAVTPAPVAYVINEDGTVTLSTEHTISPV